MITKEMEDWFEIRTAEHIKLVREYCVILSVFLDSSDIIFRGVIHDASKLAEPERTPYIYITWDYRCKREEVNYEIPSDASTDEASYTHVTTNQHHPEFWSPRKVDLFNKEDRDGIPDEIVDATSMPCLDLAEMVADWCAMAEELEEGSAYGWADKVIGERYEFTDGQVEFIYELLDFVYSSSRLEVGDESKDRG